MQQETQGLCKRPTNQHTPHGSNTRSATTTHKCSAKSQRSLTDRKPFIFYDHHDTSQRPQNPGASDGTDEFGHG